MKGKAITLPHRRSYRVVALAQSGSICIFQQHYRAKATKRPRHVGPGLLSFRSQNSCQYIRGHKSKAMRNCQRIPPPTNALVQTL